MKYINNVYKIELTNIVDKIDIGILAKKHRIIKSFLIANIL